MSDIDRFTKVKVEKETKPVIVPITSSTKPEIPLRLQKKWQNILDLIAEILKVPSGLIMKMDRDKIEVFLSSNTPNNPYKKGDHEILGLGLYCETVVGKRIELLIPDARKSKYWDKNPDIKLGMISYLGLPVNWSDGEIFGTFCVLDNKENHYSTLYKQLLYQFRDIVESDLEQLELTKELQKKLSNTELRIREVHHRIKNNFNLMISSINLQAQQIQDETQFQNVINDISNRIRAISMLNEKLYAKIDISKVSIGHYIKELGKYIIADSKNEDIDLIVKADNVTINQKIAITIGLIVSELVTNSLKYAFKQIKNPTIKISITSQSPNQLSFSYTDNGIGLPKDFNIEKATTFGMFLIQSLIDQLHSDMEIIPGDGFSCKFDLRSANSID